MDTKHIERRMETHDPADALSPDILALLTSVGGAIRAEDQASLSSRAERRHEAADGETLSADILALLASCGGEIREGDRAVIARQSQAGRDRRAAVDRRREGDRRRLGST